MVETAADSAYKGMPQLSPAMESYSETITTTLSDAYVATDTCQPSKSSHIKTPKVSAETQKELLEKTFKVIDTLATVEFIKLERDHGIPIAKSRREYKAWKLSGSKPGAEKRDARSSEESVARKSSSKKQKVMDDQPNPYPLITARSPEVNISGSIPVQQASQHVAGGLTTSASPQHLYSRSVSDPGAYQPRGTEENPLILLAGAAIDGLAKDSGDAVKEPQLPSAAPVSTSSASGLRLRIPPPSDSKKESPLPKKKGRWRLAQPMEEGHGTLSTASSGVTAPASSAVSSHSGSLPPFTTAFLTQHSSSLASDASASLAGLLRRNRDANRRMVQQISPGEQSMQGRHGETTAYEDVSE
ncbi:hypothetical protein ElyMa_000026400 [Elysia marginata]|uniref:Clr5 domain-containing protein n=1 Tax=Elysia marginata TaxID=1093978 RepID=A0AAV4ECL3_9GAST|nr:hypothetical protein ElyMa_000026400 [Elysia marginata]